MTNLLTIFLNKHPNIKSKLKLYQEKIIGIIYFFSILFAIAGATYLLATIVNQIFKMNYTDFEYTIFVCFIICFIIYNKIENFRKEELSQKEREKQDYITFINSINNFRIRIYAYRKCKIIKRITYNNNQRQIKILLKNNDVLSTSLSDLIKLFEYGIIDEDNLLNFDLKLKEAYEKSQTDYTFTISFNKNLHINFNSSKRWKNFTKQKS